MAWRRQGYASSGIEGLIADRDVVVVFSFDSVARVLDVRTGVELWSKAVGRSSDGGVAGGVVALTVGTVLTGFESTTGQQIWQFPVHGAQPLVLEAVAPDGPIVLWDNAAFLHALEPASGAEVWGAPSRRGGLLVTEDRLVVRFEADRVDLDEPGSGRRLFVAYDAKTGERVWKSSKLVGISEPGAALGSTIFFGGGCQLYED